MAETSNSQQATILIFVWALEQDPKYAGVGSARQGKKGAVPIAEVPHVSIHEDERGERVEQGEEGLDSQEGQQDVFVPWALQAPATPRARKLPMDKEVRAKLKKKTRAEWEESQLPSSLETLAVNAVASEKEGGDQLADAPEERPNFNRYYHLFRHLELSDLVRQAANSLGARYIDSSSSTPSNEQNTTPGNGQGIAVELKREVWERENWVVEIGVRCL